MHFKVSNFYLFIHYQYLKQKHTTLLDFPVAEKKCCQKV